MKSRVYKFLRRVRSVLVLMAAGACFLGIAACVSGTGRIPLSFAFEETGALKPVFASPQWPAFRMVHISDVHVHSPELGTTGTAFQKYLDHDRKLLAGSTAVLEELGKEIAAQKPDFVLVTGDLTKDGELVNHKWFASWCGGMESRGIRVFVLPGNHDINNPHGVRFLGDTTEPVEGIDPAGFADMYGAYGYNEALRRDPASLSYLAEPVPGLWLLAMDSADYENNRTLGEPVTAGRLRPETIAWVEGILDEASRMGKPVIAAMHHGLVEHWPGQKKFNPEYVVKDDLDLQRLFAHYRVPLVFSGHYHSQDVARATTPDGGFVFDVETGSPVTWPLPWRILDSVGGTMRIHTRNVENLEGVADFESEAREFTANGVGNIARDAARKYWASPEEADRIGVQAVNAFLAHYRGDEQVPSTPVPDRSHMGFMANLILDNLGYVLQGLYQDTEGADRNLEIDLSTGEWKPLDADPAP